MKRSYIGFFISIFFSAILLDCEHKDQNKIDLQVLVVATGNIITINGEVDPDKISSCGVAVPGTTATGTTGTTGGNTGATTTPSGSSGSSTRYTVTSQLIMKNTAEAMVLRFQFDSAQYQGSVDPQQGFSYSGGAFGRTVTGNVGKVEWGSSGVPVYPSGNGAAQQQTLQYLDIDISLSGKLLDSSTTTGILNQCYTSDNVNCTSVTTTQQCFTQDNKSCVSTASAAGSAVTITGNISCNAPNVIPSGSSTQ
ncbi:LIC10920 family plasminogen-binding lipoprotein [Leptospira alstonii]|uniref:Lipoprotein n=2 Tax=Leptospira alstonii TaxID=28452 RepID=M6D958_9LEPT|nr:hypothetical protein [Leptospira alstonii]EMJ95105.1 hypothetical protein LEP1GSC194_3237 [Leptospira alstonii serovar Sichuan str. 79601]EQA82297.1 hypothetical protein LEP1GSC193_3963 [Leptospira alstonii serovar Pingchang str. 80-412]